MGIFTLSKIDVQLLWDLIIQYKGIVWLSDVSTFVLGFKGANPCFKRLHANKDTVMLSHNEVHSRVKITIVSLSLVALNIFTARTSNGENVNAATQQDLWPPQQKKTTKKNPLSLEWPSCYESTVECLFWVSFRFQLRNFWKWIWGLGEEPQKTATR